MKEYLKSFTDILKISQLLKGILKITKQFLHGTKAQIETNLKESKLVRFLSKFLIYLIHS